MSLKSSPEDKSMKISTGTVTNDQATLERNFDPGPGDPSDHKVVVCYNRAGPDYRVERRDGRACSCKQTRVETK